MSDTQPRMRHDSTLRAEISEVLHIFSKATSADDIAFSVARSVCNLTRARSVVYVAAIDGIDDSSPLTIGSYGSTSLFMDYEYWRAESEEGMNYSTFKSIAHQFGWHDLDSEFVLESPERLSEGAKLYCRKISDIYGIFTGYLCIESAFNPFEFSGLDAALLVLSLGSLRFFQARGQYGAQSVILQKIIHDINGSLAVIGLQSELLVLQSNIENRFLDAQERIQSALKKADQNVQRLNEFSHLFFPERQDAEGHKSSSSPKLALNAAIASLRFTSDQMSKFHVNVAIPDFDRVQVEGIVLYWIYRATINAMTNRFMESDVEPEDVFIDLQKSKDVNECVVLSVSRKASLPVDEFMNPYRVVPYGAVNGQLVLMPPLQIMESIARLYGGIAGIETLQQARVLSIGFPSVLI